ncbi:hypothetical protein NDA13_001662 [Ustilago tritici]|nr:hypothetical protein NDA13_001662 [Ustilago tritici]
MVSSVGEDEIVATIKFKPSKPGVVARQRQREDEVLDDWDAESSDDDDVSDSNKPDMKQADVFRATKDQWTEANLQAPAAIPVVASGHGRSLPGAAYGSRLHTNNNQQTSASSSRPQAGVTIAAAPPRILQRPKEAMPGMRSDGSSAHMSNSASQERKTVEQRQEEYRLARERIFGSSLNASSSNNGSSKR